MAEATVKTEYFVGVDLGGTKILAGVFDDKLNCLGRTKMSTKYERGAEEVIDRIARCARDVVDECDLDFKQVRAMGIGAPGAVDPETGRVIFAPNLQWQDVPVGLGFWGSDWGVESECNRLVLFNPRRSYLRGLNSAAHPPMGKLSLTNWSSRVSEEANRPS